MKRIILSVMVFLFCINVAFGFSAKGTLYPLEVSICMEGETHVLFDPCTATYITYLDFLIGFDPSLNGQYVEVSGDEVGFLCNIIGVEEINYLGDPYADFDDDGYWDACDNCPSISNPRQEDSYPPGGNGIGDACDCEGNFDCDNDCDGTDAADFKQHFGRSPFTTPCANDNQCHGDFDCDGDCDGTDAANFKQDFGRSGFSNPCPACVVVDWCVYE